MAPRSPATRIGTAVLRAVPALSGIAPLHQRLAPASCGPRHPAHIALTFDDGPHPEGTPAVLRVLEAKGCRATFFVVGEQARRHQHLVRAIHNDGHEVAVHGWTHTPTPLLSPTQMGRHLRDTTALIGDLTDHLPGWYRPPYGVASRAALAGAQALGLRPMWWTRWARDWDRRATVDSITARAVNHLGQLQSVGGTLLLHDSDTYGRRGSWQLTAAALPMIVSTLRGTGLRLGSLSDVQGPPAD